MTAFSHHQKASRPSEKPIAGPAATAACLALGVMLASAGCRDSPQTDSSAPSITDAALADTAPADAGSQAQSATASAAAKEVTVQFATWAETQSLVGQHAGKVVVLDIWSTYCVPCMREFPGLVKLQQDYPDDVVAISLNCNYAGVEDEPPQHAQAAVEKFLRQQKATIVNVICTDPDIKLFEQLDLGSIPAVLVYDQHGKLHKRFDNDSNEYGEEGFGYEKQIIPLVESLLQGGDK